MYKSLVFGNEFLAQGQHLKSHQRCSAGFLQNRQVLPHWLNHHFSLILVLYTEALSCYNRKGSCPNCCYKIRSTQFPSVTNLVATHHATAAHHPWTTTPIIHCTTTHTFPSTITPITQLSPITNQPWLSCHTCTSFTHPHISSTLPYTRCKVLFCPGWHSERFPCILFPCVYLDCLYDSDHLLPAFLTLPALWYPLCLPPAPTFALYLVAFL